MNQQKFQASGGGQSQADRILAELAANAGEWVPMPRLARIGAGTEHGFCMVHSRIAGLNKLRRAKNLPVIENDSRHRLEDGTVVSAYRLPVGPAENLPADVPPQTSSIGAAQAREDASNNSTLPARRTPAVSSCGGASVPASRSSSAASPHHGELFDLDELRRPNSAREMFA